MNATIIAKTTAKFILGYTLYLVAVVIFVLVMFTLRAGCDMIGIA